MLRLGDDLYRTAYFNTFKISVISTIGGGLLGFGLAWAITVGRLPGRIRDAVISFCGVASNFAGLPLALAFIAALGRVGVITQALKSIGISLYPDFSMYSFTGVVIAYTYFQIPLMVLIMTPPLDGLRSEWREAADNLGASRVQYWRMVMLPILMPSLLSALALLFVNAFGAYATAFALVGGGAGETMIVSILVRAQFSNDSLTNPHVGYALAFGMIIVAAITMVVYSLSRQRAERWRRSVS
jgi:putative spermidine/putrescine transport system permease protein